jgi:hypothetical protein
MKFPLGEFILRSLYDVIKGCKGNEDSMVGRIDSLSSKTPSGRIGVLADKIYMCSISKDRILYLMLKLPQARETYWNAILQGQLLCRMK